MDFQIHKQKFWLLLAQNAVYHRGLAHLRRVLRVGNGSNSCQPDFLHRTGIGPFGYARLQAVDVAR